MRPEELERLYAEHASGVYGFLVYRTGDRSLAEDLLADTFVRALSTRVKLDRRRGGEKAWLYSIALNLLRDHLRREGARSRAFDRLDSEPRAVPDELGRVDERDELARALAALTPEERELIALRYGGELTVPELAALTGHPLTTIEGRLYRALGRLRRELT
jgi:RNA polymerase sigma factor (sigma-70 family)